MRILLALDLVGGVGGGGGGVFFLTMLRSSINFCFFTSRGTLESYERERMKASKLILWSVAASRVGEYSRKFDLVDLIE